MNPGNWILLYTALDLLVLRGEANTATSIAGLLQGAMALMPYLKALAVPGLAYYP